MAKKQLNFETLCLHGGYNSYDHNNAGSVPIYQSSAYTYDNAEHAADLFALNDFGYIYSRINNPTQGILENRIALLEKGKASLALSSGHAAEHIALTNILEKGDNIVSSSHLYGGTYNLFKVTFKKIGIESRFFHPDNLDEIDGLIDEKTKAIYVETIGNPSLSIVDFDELSKKAEKYNIPLVVDNTFATPYLFNPIDFGASIVVHSMTKYIGGHGTSIGGVIVDSGNYDWGKTDKYPGITKESEGYHGLCFYDRFGPDSKFDNISFIVKARVEGLRDYGSCISPFNAFLFLQGLETLSLRMEKHSSNALALAGYLEKHSKVINVNYPGLKSSKYFDRAKKYFPKGASGMFTFELDGGRENGKRFIENVKVALHETNLGDSRTIVTHPSSTTHQQMSDEEQIECGVGQSLIRVSVGLENVEDLKEDFDQAIDKAFL